MNSAVAPSLTLGSPILFYRLPSSSDITLHIGMRQRTKDVFSFPTRAGSTDHFARVRPRFGRSIGEKRGGRRLNWTCKAAASYTGGDV